MDALCYWHFKDVGFRFEHVCNKFHNVLMTASELKKKQTILNVKEVDFRCILWGITSIDDAVNRLNNSVLEDKGVFKNGFWCK